MKRTGSIGSLVGPAVTRMRMHLKTSRRKAIWPLNFRQISGCNSFAMLLSNSKISLETPVLTVSTLSRHSAIRGPAKGLVQSSLPVTFVVCVLTSLATAVQAQVVMNEIMYHPYEPWPPHATLPNNQRNRVHRALQCRYSDCGLDKLPFRQRYQSVSSSPLALRLVREVTWWSAKMSLLSRAAIHASRTT